MIEGALFYWFSWLGWIWTTFLLNKRNETRVSLSLWLLVLMIFSPYHLQILGMDFYFSVFVSLSFFILSTVKLGNKIFISVFLSSFIIALGYVSFLLFELFDPVWVLFDRKWMIAIGGILLSSVLQTRPYLRVYGLIAGMLLGEILFSVLMKRLSFLYPVGSPAFLDTLALTFMVMAVWAGFSYLTQASGNFINYGRGKQKSS